jgi:hypothetical protein
VISPFRPAGVLLGYRLRVLDHTAQKLSAI